MIGAELARNLPCVIQLVIVLVREPDRKCLYRARTDTRHGRHDGARIDAATEKCAQRNIRNEAEPDGFLQKITQSLYKVLLGFRVVGIKFDVPVLPDTDSMPRRRRHQMTGLEFVYTLDDAFIRRRSHAAEKMIDGCPTELSLDLRQLKHDF